MKNNFKVITEIDNRQLKMVLFSLIVGLGTGVVTVIYRLALHYAEEFAFWINSYIAGDYKKIIIWFIVLIINGYIIGFILKRNRLIGGSGIPQVKGILMGYLKSRWISTFFGKFIGSLITIGSGLSLGREGPSIQLGACVGEGLSRYMTKARIEKKMLMVSGASAGLAAAFNAPFAGVMFALEEIFRYFTPMLLLSTMTAAVAADFVSKQVFGLDAIFSYNITNTIALNSYWILVPMGIILGVAGAVYNYVLIATRNIYFKANFIPASLRTVIPFIIAGVVGLTFPAIMCGGHNITEALAENPTFSLLLALLLGKFLFSMVCFGSGAPGGIFFPLLVIGSIIGAIFGKVAIAWAGIEVDLLNNFIILSMAGFFTAIVRAPITGIILITEMSGSYHQILPLSFISIIAYVVANLLKSKPVYDSLLDIYLENFNSDTGEESDKKIMIEAIVHHDALISNMLVRDIKWPERTLLLSIRRHGRELIPKGDTMIHDGDHLIAMTDLNQEWLTREELIRLTTNED